MPGQLVSSFGVTERTVRIVELAPPVTYQFFENRFAHPFVVVIGTLSLIALASS